MGSTDEQTMKQLAETLIQNDTFAQAYADAAYKRFGLVGRPTKPLSHYTDEREFLEGLTLLQGPNGVGYDIHLGVRIGVSTGGSNIRDLNNLERVVWYRHGPAERDMVVTFARVLEHAFKERFPDEQEE